MIYLDNTAGVVKHVEVDGGSTSGEMRNSDTLGRSSRSADVPADLDTSYLYGVLRRTTRKSQPLLPNYMYLDISMMRLHSLRPLEEHVIKRPMSSCHRSLLLGPIPDLASGCLLRGHAFRIWDMENGKNDPPPGWQTYLPYFRYLRQQLNFFFSLSSINCPL